MPDSTDLNTDGVMTDTTVRATSTIQHTTLDTVSATLITTPTTITCTTTAMLITVSNSLPAINMVSVMEDQTCHTSQERAHSTITRPNISSTDSMITVTTDTTQMDNTCQPPTTTSISTAPFPCRIWLLNERHV